LEERAGSISLLDQLIGYLHSRTGCVPVSHRPLYGVLWKQTVLPPLKQESLWSSSSFTPLLSISTSCPDQFQNVFPGHWLLLILTKSFFSASTQRLLGLLHMLVCLPGQLSVCLPFLIFCWLLACGQKVGSGACLPLLTPGCPVYIAVSFLAKWE
jgi:hypothetical protein